MKKSKILYVTPPDVTENNRGRCGVSLTGSLLANGLKEHPIYNVEVIYTDSPIETMVKIKDFKPNAVIFNHHAGVNPWMAQLNLREFYPDIKGLCIIYDKSIETAKNWNPNNSNVWQYMLTYDNFVESNEHVFSTTHVLPEGKKSTYKESTVPIIGWQGFPAPWKGVHRIAEQVQKEFDEAIIRLHMPDGFTTYPKNFYGPAIFSQVQNIITKPGIKIEYSDHWLDDSDIVDWLSQNTVNCYFYDYLEGAGMSGSIDYALAAGRPIAITKSFQFKTFWNLNPTILIEETSLRQIIANGTQPLEPLYNLHTKEQLWDDYTNIFRKLGL